MAFNGAARLLLWQDWARTQPQYRSAFTTLQTVEHTRPRSLHRAPKSPVNPEGHLVEKAPTEAGR
jgi:hypothetical protein